jgi:RHS repeat-associated protein
MRHLLVAGFVLFAVSFSSVASAQAPSVTYSTFTPTSDVGHDYIGLLSEMVNPADGSVSVRINLPVPKPGRGPAVSLGFGYDSNVHFVVPGVPGQASWATRGTPWAKGAWSLLVPTLSEIQGTIVFGSSNPPVTCGWWGDFLFTAANGTSSGLGLALAQQLTNNDESCGIYSTYSHVGDFFQAFIPSSTQYIQGDAFPPTVTVAGPDGTVYYFAQAGPSVSPSGVPNGQIALPTFIEDRNGNKVTFNVTAGSPSVFSITDSAGRTVASSTGFGQTSNGVTVSGISGAFTTTWETASNPSWNLAPVNLDPGDASNCIYGFPAPPTGGSVIKSIALPNGQSYQFSYDSTYGLLKQIVYPSGGTVTYTWGVHAQSQTAAWLDSASGGGNKIGCMWRYGTPAIMSRVVSFDGKTNALQQTFSYAPVTWYTTDPLQWTTMSTTVTTSDLVTGQSFATAYNYVPAYGATQPLDIWTLAPAGVPVESSVQYFKDTNTSGTPVRAVTKGWAGVDVFQLGCQVTTLDNGLISGEFLTYSGDLVTDKKEYDFGQLTSGTSCAAPSSPKPIRETVAAPQTFAVTPIYSVNPSLFDLPSSTIVYGNGTLVAETDYSYDQFSVASASATQHDETLYPASVMSPRGNATTVVRKCLQAAPACASGNPTTTYNYDETGQVVSMTDPCGNASCSDMTGTNHTTTYSYLDSYTSGTPPSNTNAYLTKMAYPTPADGVAQVTKNSYSYSDGQLTVATDENGLSTTYTYGDPLDRLTLVTYPTGGGETIYAYNDAAPSPSVKTQREIGTGTFLTTNKVMDGVGHVVDSQISSAPVCATVHSTTSYDGIGQPYQVSNPYCTTTDATYGLTTYLYDALSRNTLVTNPDKSKRQIVYGGRAAEVSDEGNGTNPVQRITQTDALGRMISVCEVSNTTLTFGGSPTPVSCGQDVAGTGFLTTYQYDAMDNLTGESQAGLNPRSYSYDSLSRLMSSTNPESGTAKFSYDANGNLVSKISPEPNQTNPAVTVTATDAYDVLNRDIRESFSDGSAEVQSYYDQNSNNGYFVGRLTARGTFNVPANSWFAMTQYGYDTMGRINAERQCVIACSTFWNLNYTYDFLGDLLTATDGKGTTLTYGYNSATQVTSVTSSLSDANHPSSLLSGVLYNAPGRLTSASMGTITSTSGMSEARTYDNRLRTLGITTGVNTPTGAVGLESVAYGYAPNGDVTSLADGPTGNWTFTYDDFNRLKTTNSAWAGPYAYGYDRYGNRWQQTANGSCTAGASSCISFDANNHVTGGVLTYDAAGNVIADNIHHYTYDAENHLMQVDAGTTASYLYDGAGHRVQTTIAGTTVNYLYNPSRQLVTEVSSTGGWNRGEVYARGRHLATYRNGLTYFSSVDVLGTERVRSTQTESSFESCASLPFGDDQSCSGPATGTVSPLHFTGKNRDSESGLDNFEARMMSSGFGRFMSPDPLDGDTEDPQTLNKYSYVRDNPLGLTDPTGMDSQGVGPTAIEEASIHACGDQEDCIIDLGAEFDANQATAVAQAVPGVKRSWLNRLVGILGNWAKTGESLSDDDVEQERDWLRRRYFNPDGTQPDYDKMTNRQIVLLYNSVQWALLNDRIQVISLLGPGGVLLPDKSGKIHEDIPDFPDPKMTKEELQEQADALRESIKQRNAEQSQYGEEAGHRERIRREEKYLRQVLNRLGGSK